MTTTKIPSKCQNPGCNCDGPLYLHSRCHPNSPTWTVKHGDTLLIVCAVCDKGIVSFKVVEESA